MQNMSESPDNTNRVTRRTIVLTSGLPCKTKLQANNNRATKELQYMLNLYIYLYCYVMNLSYVLDKIVKYR